MHDSSWWAEVIGWRDVKIQELSMIVGINLPGYIADQHSYSTGWRVSAETETRGIERCCQTRCLLWSNSWHSRGITDTARHVATVEGLLFGLWVMLPVLHRLEGSVLNSLAPPPIVFTQAFILTTMWYCADWWDALLESSSSFVISLRWLQWIPHCQKWMCTISDSWFWKFGTQPSYALLPCSNSWAKHGSLSSGFLYTIIICGILIGWNCLGDWQPRTLCCLWLAAIVWVTGSPKLSVAYDRVIGSQEPSVAYHPTLAVAQNSSSASSS